MVDNPVASVVVSSKRAGCRVARAGLSRLPDHTRVVEAAQGKQIRVRVLLAVLALAVEHTLPEERAFGLTYGFAFDGEVHRGVFNVLIHRARAALGRHGELVRSRDELRLVLHSPIAIADPRCDRDVGDRILSFVGRRGRVGAREIASALGVSVRHTQNTLGTLIESGACTKERAGRRIEYVVEDTTFSEPTNTHHEVQIGGSAAAADARSAGGDVIEPSS